MNELPPSGIDLEKLQQDAVGYFLRAANPGNGLIADSSREGAPCSIAATGLGLAAYIVGAEQRPRLARGCERWAFAGRVLGSGAVVPRVLRQCEREPRVRPRERNTPPLH